MPAIVTCKDTRCENTWNVGSDDFVVPGIIAIVVGLFNISLLGGALVALYYVPFSSVFEDLVPCVNLTTIPPILYGPLFSLTFVEVLLILNEGLIVALSAQGPMLKEKGMEEEMEKHSTFLMRQNLMPHLIYLRIVLAILELLAIIAALVGCFHNETTSLIDVCEAVEPRIEFVQAVVVIQAILYLLFLVKVCLYTDPLGLSTPGLLERLELFDSVSQDPERGLRSEPSTDISPDKPDGREYLNSFQSGRQNSREIEGLSLEASLAAREVNIWKHRRTVFGIHRDDVEAVTKVHRDNIGRKKYERRLGALMCCLGVKGQRSRGAALNDVARALYTVLSDTETVLSDILAGFSLLKEQQRKKMEKGGEISLARKFRKVTFTMMSSVQRKGISPDILREDAPFDFTTTRNQLLFEDLTYYMKYAMGAYGWPLYVFDNPCCGVCHLCKVTCCKFRCRYEHVKKWEYSNDNCCMCGTGTFRLETGAKEEDILCVSLENNICTAPFFVCLDHKMKSLVVSVRGTLSIKDALTDMSFSPVHKRLRGIKQSYIHGGMYKTAIVIQNTLRLRGIIQNTLKEYPGYQVVITGHSLGAGVASILALLLEQEMMGHERLKCYAYSPPGALLSFPLAEHSKSFITSVVLGNDLIPRFTMRALLHLKFSIKDVLEKSKQPKYEVLCIPKSCASLCKCLEGGKSKSKESSLKKQSEEEERGSSNTKTATAETPLPSLVADYSEVGDKTDVEETDGGPAPAQTTGATDDDDDENCVEYQVFQESTTTADIRQKLFNRSVSIQPQSSSAPHSMPTPSASVPHKLQRFISSRPSLQKQYSVTPSFAQKLRKAVSLDADAAPTMATSHIEGTDGHSVSSFTNKEVPVTFNIQNTHIEEEEEEEEETTETFRQRADSVPAPRTAKVKRVPLKGTRNVVTDADDYDEFRGRIISDPTPDSILNISMKDLREQHCYAIDETKDFVPFFPPGRLLHIRVHPSKRCCGKNNFDVMEVNCENMCVILADNGIVDDHLPNHVLNALQTCKATYMKNYDQEAVERERKKLAERLTMIRDVTPENSVCPVSGFNFGMKERKSLTTESIGSNGAVSSGKVRNNIKRSQLNKQRSFDDFDGVDVIGMTSMRQPVSSSTNQTVLTPLTESRDEEEEVDVVVAENNQVTVEADVSPLAVSSAEGSVRIDMSREEDGEAVQKKRGNPPKLTIVPPSDLHHITSL